MVYGRRFERTGIRRRLLDQCQLIRLDLIGLRDYQRIAAQQQKQLAHELEQSAACVDAMERFARLHGIVGGDRKHQKRGATAVPQRAAWRALFQLRLRR